MLYILAGSTSPPTINTGTAGSRRSRDRHQPGEQHASRLEVLPPTSASNHPNATRWWCRYKAQTPAEDLVEARKETGRDQGHNSRPPACHHTPTALSTEFRRSPSAPRPDPVVLTSPRSTDGCSALRWSSPPPPLASMRSFRLRSRSHWPSADRPDFSYFRRNYCR